MASADDKTPRALVVEEARADVSTLSAFKLVIDVDIEGEALLSGMEVEITALRELEPGVPENRMVGLL